MGMSKNLSNYSDTFFELAKAIEEKGTVKIENLPKTIAHSMRFQFYGFRTALAAEPSAIAPYPQLSGALVRIQPARAPERFDILFIAADKTDISLLLKESLSKPELAPAPAPAPAPAENPSMEALVSAYIRPEKSFQ